MSCRSFLAGLHARLQPQAYLELGVGDGERLALARCRAVGVDPAYAIRAELDGDIALFRTSPDAWFAGHDPVAVAGRPFDLTVIAGPLLVEQALRSFVHAERVSRAGGLVVVLDTLPRTAAEAARQRRTEPWVGDAYRLLDVLARHRPELVLTAVDEPPRGLTVISGLDPASTVLADGYAEIVAELRATAGGPLPAAVTDRLRALPGPRYLEAFGAQAKP